MTVRYRVKAYNAGGDESDYFNYDEVPVDNNYAPIISDRDMHLGYITSAPTYSFTVNDQDSDQIVMATTSLKRIGREDFPLREFVANTNREYVTGIGDYWLELDSTPSQLVIEATDDLDQKDTRKISFTRKINRLAASRAFETDQPVQKCLIALYPLDKSPDVMVTLQASNNPFDDIPVWEDMSAKVNCETHVFQNTAVETPGLGYRFGVTKGDEYVELHGVNIRYI